MDLRKIEEIFFRILMFCSTVIIAVSLIIIIFSTFYKGLPHLTWEMISKTPKGGFYFGKEGGVRFIYHLGLQYSQFYLDCR